MSSSKPPLSVHNAAVSTANVEIKTLTVSGKQVTLAVFRQIREGSLITDAGDFVGQPWGIINYHADKCTDEPTHMHVLWQFGDQLRRDKIYRNPQHEVFHCSEADEFYAACIYELITSGTTPFFTQPPQYGRLVTDMGLGFQSRLDLSPSGCHALEAWHRLEAAKKTPINRSYQEADLAAAMEKFRVEVGKLGATADELYQRYVVAMVREREDRERCLRRIEEVALLPQLFIAV